jgi:hypothetical protein
MPLVKILAHPVSGTVQIARLSSGENATTLAKVSFFAEGAANALFHFQAQNADTAALGVIPPSCLLRVRKGRWTPGASKAAAPPAFVDFKSMVKFLAEDILSALGNEQVVKHEVVELGPGIIDLLDDSAISIRPYLLCPLSYLRSRRPKEEAARQAILSSRPPVRHYLGNSSSRR